MATEYRRVYRVQGMDTAPANRFQMVPNTGRRWIALHDGAGLTLTSSNTSICTITEVREADIPTDDDRATGPNAGVHGDRFFRLDGKTTGTCTITAAGGSGAPVVLDVRVKDRFTQNVRFWRVSDNAGHISTRPFAEVGQFIPMLNYIFGKQANIRFTRHASFDPIAIARNLGDPIQLPGTGGLGTDATDIVNQGDGAVDLNVFFVWELRRAATGDSTEATTQTIGSAHAGSGPGNILMEDDIAGRDDLALAHEVGHHLGLNHNTASAINLMFDTSPLQGFALSRDEVNIANTL